MGWFSANAQGAKDCKASQGNETGEFSVRRRECFVQKIGPGKKCDASRRRVSPGISPRAHHRCVLDSLRHPARAIRRGLPFSANTSGRQLAHYGLSVDDLPPHSTDMTPLHRYYEVVHPGCRIRTLALVVLTTCDFSVRVDTKVPTFRTTASSGLSPRVCRMPLRP